MQQPEKEPSCRFPKRVVVTSGMPYGNKDLHFGHVGGLFIHADLFARFMRDRIGKENVLFVSGTDCYGSPVVEYHRQAIAKHEFNGSLENFVEFNNKRQREVLDAYDISTNIFAASGLEPSRTKHHSMCAWFLKTLHDNGHLKKISSLQFFDHKARVLINGRQVVGRCPVPGCKSDKAYADECELGHPYEPKELIAPKSTLSGETPELKEVANWYLDLEKFRTQLVAWTNDLETDPQVRPFVVSGIREFLEPPTIYLKLEQEEELQKIVAAHKNFPQFTRELSKNQALKYIFKDLKERDVAGQIFTAAGVRFRNGKTLVPFRLTGNVEWGVPAQAEQGEAQSTWWVWPESLIAPISFCQTFLDARKQGDISGADSQGATSHEPTGTWQDWWCQSDAAVYQFIGEDNLYFYSLAEMGLFLGMQGKDPVYPVPEGYLQPPRLIVNNHILFFEKKASSSSDIKPPMARDLLNYYTSDQLRAHFLALSLGIKSTGFKPKPFNPKAGEKDADPVLKDGNLLSNAFNKSVRTCFYTVQKYNSGKIPVAQISENIMRAVAEVVQKYESTMMRFSFHELMNILDTFLRDINKHWTANIKVMEGDFENNLSLKHALADNFHMLRIATVLVHPVAPRGTELIFEYLGLQDQSFWSWERINEPIYAFMKNPETHTVKELPPRFDFFPKHQSQFGA